MLHLLFMHVTPTTSGTCRHRIVIGHWQDVKEDVSTPQL